MSDRAFDEWLRGALRGFREPPEPDREAMWRRIDAARRPPARGNSRPGDWKRWGLGMAAMLAVAIAIGQWAPPGTRRPANDASARLAEGASQPAAGVRELGYLAAEHLSRTEALLVIFRTAPQGGGVDPEVVRWARDLLSTTRLLMDWSAAEDPRLARLLSDLELVLAQIVQLPVSPQPGERSFIERSIDSAEVLPRLRALLPPQPLGV